MAATAPAPPNLGSLTTGGGDHEDSNISSPLSEVDDKDANDEDINLNIGHEEDEQADEEADDNGDDESSLTEEDVNEPSAREASDSESALSDARSVAASDANDTEAETERLFDTPQNPRHRDVVVDQFNDGHIFEHTPSKLRRGVMVADDEEKAHNGSVSGDDASVASSRGNEDDSPSKPATTNNTSVDEDLQNESQDRKRKRSLVGDHSDSEQPLRKRTGSVGAADQAEDVPADEAMSIDHKDEAIAGPEEADSNKQEAEEVATPEPEERAPKKPTRSSRRRGGIASHVEDEAADETTLNEVVVTAEEVVEPHDEIADEAEEEIDAAAKNAEEGQYLP